MSRNKYPKNTPARIFLVMGEEDVTPEDNFLELAEITWCSEKVYKTDVEYVRKDLYDAVKKKLEKAEEASFDYQRELGMVDSVSDEHVVARRMGFRDGYRKAEKDTIERAVAWLKEHANNYIVDLTPTYPDAPVNIVVGGKCWEDLKRYLEYE